MNHSPYRAVVRATGHAVPPRVLTNAELAATVDTTDEWIFTRTGIRERHICEGEEGTYSLALDAGREALERSGLAPEDIGLVVVGTVSGDFLWPACACFVQEGLGIPPTAAFDVSAACAGFVYGVATAAAFLESGAHRHALVIGVDALSKQLNWEDRSTCILFGDAAGAIVLSAEPSTGDAKTDRGVLKTVLYSDGSGSNLICVESGGTKYPRRKPTPVAIRETIYMAGKEVYRFAVNAMGDACTKLLAEADVTSDEIALFVPHQANIRIIQSAAEHIGLSMDRVFVNVDKYGNTSAGSVPLALYEAEAEGRLKEGDLVMTVGFGAGVVWGANLIRW